MAVVQSVEAERVAEQRAELTLLAMTERAIEDQRRQIQRALGTAQSLAATVPSLMGSERCDEAMTRLVAESGRYTAAGYVRLDGALVCATDGARGDFSGMPDFADTVANPRPRVEINMEAPISGQAVVIASHPVDADLGGGFAFVSVAYDRLGAEETAAETRDSLELVTFNTQGEVLTAQPTREGVEDRLPAGWTLESAVGRPADVRVGTDRLGRQRTFAVVPILAGTVYGLGSWEGEALPTGPFGLAVPTWAFPILMWAASLVVAYVAVHRLVIRHVRGLGIRIRGFAEDRRLAGSPLDAHAPAELAEMETAFDAMAERILRDEAEAENRLHEQKVLLREVHHRVKNNLQLISSIINLQMRQIDSPSTHQVLRRIQDRVLGLATMHRNLVETEAGTIRAHTVLHDIVAQLADMSSGDARLALEFDMDPLEIFPDQAVPLSLFVTEATTNAVKYVGRPEDGRRPWIAASLKRDEDGSVWVAITNSKGEAVRPRGEGEDGTGLGNQLIRAFAMQLDAAPLVEETPGTYRIALRFRPAGFEAEPPGDAPLRAAQ
jgi:two-component sensor histidine kinase